MTQDLTGFVPLPAHPAYLVHPDGRVYSHKVDRVVSETKATRSVMVRVRIGRLLVRVRDLVYLVHGDTAVFEARINAEVAVRMDDLDRWAEE